VTAVELCAFIGDEVTAAGFRLAGARVHLVPPEDAAALLREPGCALLVVTAEVAAGIPEALLEQATARPWPLLLVVPDAAGRHSPPDLAVALRRQLGMGS
jgi:vacuolar-type H+-ATPase subunit F/Vma7